MNRYRWLAFAVMTALILPRIAQRGMFLDGITYAVIARNMAIGAGSLWHPFFSDTVYPVFYEQPPLGLWLESLAFRVLGDHLFVERLFSVLVFALTGLTMMAIWRRVLRPWYDSLPIFFWAVPSVVTWAAVNNILEVTQGLFTVVAVYCVIRAAERIPAGAAAAWTLGASACVLAACLTKGPVGLFPLAAPLFLLLRAPDERPTALRALAIVAGMTLACGAAIGLLLTAEAPKAALEGFARTHLVPALSGARGMPRRSADIARHLTFGVWARMAVLAVVLWFARRKETALSPLPRMTLVFLLIGLSGSAPILMSPVLAGHYFVPSIPFFALAAAALSLPAVQTFARPNSERGSRVPVIVGAALLVLAVMVPAVKGPLEPRDVRLLDGFDAIAPIVPTAATIGTCRASAADWGLHSYMQRFFRVSLEGEDPPRRGWFLVREEACAAPVGCTRAAGNEAVALYRCGL